MSEYTRLAAEATPRPWSAVPLKPGDTQIVITDDDTLRMFIGIPSATGLDGQWNRPKENAALIVALVNAAPDIERLWKVADANTRDNPAVEALRPLFGEE